MSKESTDRTSSPLQTILLPLTLVVAMTIVAQLISLGLGRSNPEQSFASILVPSVLFLTVATVPLAGLGIALGRQIGLGTPLLSSLLTREPGSATRLRRETGIATVLGLILGVSLLGVRMITGPYLPPELPAFGHRGVIGGLAVSLGAAIAEEVWFRLGLMTILVWVLSKSLGHREARPSIVWSVIGMTSFAFGMAHLPQLVSYGAGSVFAIGGTLLGNSAVGILYGWCYWRRSLIAAMIAHFVVDLVLHVFPALVK